MLFFFFILLLFYITNNVLNSLFFLYINTLLLFINTFENMKIRIYRAITHSPETNNLFLHIKHNILFENIFVVYCNYFLLALYMN